MMTIQEFFELNLSAYDEVTLATTWETVNSRKDGLDAVNRKLALWSDYNIIDFTFEFDDELGLCLTINCKG